MFIVDHLSKEPILKNLSFKIEQGKIAIFLGESGAGKSTLLRILNNLETYDRGSFFLDGEPLNLADVGKNHTVGMVFQHFNLFENLNVEENITLPLKKGKGIDMARAKEIAMGLLKRYSLEGKATSSIYRLSGGQKQRLAIARTLALDPKIICLDEPTSALDPKLTSQVAACIKGLASENRIVLLTTHDTHLIEHLDGELFLLEQGTIIETAPKKECLSNPEKYPKLENFLRGI